MRTRDDSKDQTRRPPGSPEASGAAVGGVPSEGESRSGQCTEVVDTPDEFPISPHVLRRNNISVLRVKGDCMRDADLCDGDYLLMERFRVPAEGDLVVASTGTGESRLGRFHRDVRGVRLESANPSPQDMVSDEGDVEIWGVVLGILRKYTT